MKFPASLKQSLTLHFVAVAVLPLLFLGVIGLRYFENKHLETTLRLLDAYALNVSHEASEFLLSIDASLSQIEKTLNSGVLHSDAEIDQYLQIACNEPNSFESIYMLDKDHRVTNLGFSARHDVHREDYLATDLSAHEIFSRQPQLSGHTWSDVSRSMITNEPAIKLGIPMANGTLIGTVSLKRLSTEMIVRMVHVSRDFQFTLLDRHGVMVADSRPEQTSQLFNIDLHPEVRNALDRQLEVSNWRHEDSRLLESVRLVPETGWVAYVSLSLQKTMQGVAPSRYLLTSIVAFAACLGAFLSIWLSQRLLRPILLLRDATWEVAKGNYDQSLQSAHYRELEDLSGSFREMVDAVEEREHTIMNSEARFRSLFTVMGEGLLILGPDGEVVQCNQTAEKIMQVKSDALLGKCYDELIHNAFCEEGRLCERDQYPAFLTLHTGEAVVNKVLGFSRADGQVIWLQINTHALDLDRDGKPHAIVLSFSDVTRLKTVENELRENETYMQTVNLQFQGVLEAIPDHLMILDRQMRVIWLNRLKDDNSPSEQKLFASACCYELPGVWCGPSLGSSIALCDDCPVKSAFITGRTEVMQKELPDGRNLSLRASPVFNDLGQIINVIQIVQDVTETLSLHAQAMRTGQLAALGELAAGVAHEINNPINGVINCAQLILNKAVVDSREAELSQRIIRESERVATIVRELLYFAREESQESQITSIEGALNEALALFQNQLSKEGIQLQIFLPEDLPKIVSRSHQVQRLFLNLISNACHALSEKYPGINPDKILQVNGENLARDGRPFVRITFLDHGTGIDPEFLPRVMNPFTTTKASKDGTGLGLSISREIALKHGGTLSISSVHGESTAVVIELPAMKS